MGAQKGTSSPACAEACECVCMCVHVCACATIVMYTSGRLLEELSPVA